AHGLSHMRTFCPWYDDEHHHSGIAYLGPGDVHYGRVDEVLTRRQRVLDLAYAAHPERFVRKPPAPLLLPRAVYINPPSSPDSDEGEPGLPAPEAPLILLPSVAAGPRSTAVVPH